MDLTKGSIWQLLRKVTIPASTGSLFQTFYNLVDTYFAGRISPEALAAIAKSWPIYFIAIAVAVGIGAGTTALISNSIGAKEDKKSNKYEEGVSCPRCYDTLSNSQKTRFRMRQNQINLAKKAGRKHKFQKEF